MPENRFQAASEDFLAERKLRRHAGVWQLWALGVGAVISGDFFGWNFGLASGGFGGMCAALLLVTCMYFGLCFSIAEMSAALPHTGGAYSFARTAFGPWGGYITGLAENMEYILTPAVIVSGIGGYLTTLTGTPEAYAPLWWLFCYVAFVAMNAAGVELSFRFGLVVTLVALATLVYYWAQGLPRLDLARWASPFWPRGDGGILPCLPFALWFYLAIEQLPLAAEESHDPVRDIPRGLRYGLFTLIACAFLTLIVAAGTPPGAAVVGKANDPLAASLGAFAVLALAGLVASFHTIIYAYGRQIYSLSRAGYFPVWLSKTHGQRQTPQRALITGAVMGYAAALAIHFSPRESPVGAVLLNMAVFGAVLAYVMQMASFLQLRSRFAQLPRPYLSPLGRPGAWIAMVLAALTLGALFANVDYRKGVYGALAWFAVGVAWFAFVARHRLILSPEEEFAEEQRRKQA